ncbi:MAG: nucleotidyltransferase family protein [Bacteroidales bacterium]
MGLNAFIFAAGLGSRLKPFTGEKPKALVEVNNTTLLERAINKLSQAGIQDIVINIHHFGDQILDFLNKRPFQNVNIKISDEQDLLLDTGGGLKKAMELLNPQHPFIAYNVDIISNIDLTEMIQFHKARAPLATLAVRSRKSSRYLLFDNQNRLKGWQNSKTGKQILLQDNPKTLRKQAFSGIQIIQPEIFKRMPGKNVFSVIELYLEMAREYDIIAYNHDHSAWFDVGTPEKLKQAESYLKTTE